MPCTRCPVSATTSTWSPLTLGYGHRGMPGRGCGAPRCPVPPPVRPQLSLRAASASRSAFASFFFMPLFFQRYEPGPPSTRCKVLMKVQAPPRSPLRLCLQEGQAVMLSLSPVLPGRVPLAANSGQVGGALPGGAAALRWAPGVTAALQAR